MRVMLDTNVLISALLFPSQKMNHLFENIIVRHTMVLSSYVVDELYKVTERKFPGKLSTIEKFLTRMSYELVYTPKSMENNLIYIRDINDYPVIYTAFLEDVDVLITGDKDFKNLRIDRPEIMTPSEYLEKYSNS